MIRRSSSVTKNRTMERAMADRKGLRGTCEGAMVGLVVEERLRKGLANEREETEVEVDRLERVVKMGEGFLGPRLV